MNKPVMNAIKTRLKIMIILCFNILTSFVNIHYDHIQFSQMQPGKLNFGGIFMMSFFKSSNSHQCYHCWQPWCFLMMFSNVTVINNNKGMTRPKIDAWNNHIFLLNSPADGTVGKTISE